MTAHFAPSPTGTAYELTTDRYSAGELQVVSLRGVEQISKPYAFEILLLGTSIDAASLERDLLGQRATLWMRASGDEAYPFHGILRRIEAEGISGGGEERHRFRVWLAPRLWLLGRGRNSRIFQDRTVREIVDAVLTEGQVDHTFRLMGALAPRKYCVQHQESDLAFVRRLLAEEGIFYTFEHPPDQGRELLVLCDDAHLCPPIAGSPDLTFRDSAGMAELSADVRRFRLSRRVAPGSTLLTEFDFLRPSLDLHATAEARGPDGGFDRTRIRVYDHHGEFEGVTVDGAAASRHLEQHRTRAAVAEGESRCRRLAPGRTFSLAGDALSALDGRYTVIRVEHEGHTPEIAQAGGAPRDVYQNRFACVPIDVTPRPKRPKRRIQQVMETAVVVGPAGQEIHTDEHGRIKVQFHWDREGRRNEHSSCWIRTVQAWAGTGWGDPVPSCPRGAVRGVTAVVTSRSITADLRSEASGKHSWRRAMLTTNSCWDTARTRRSWSRRNASTIARCSSGRSSTRVRSPWRYFRTCSTPIVRWEATGAIFVRSSATSASTG